MKIAVLVNQYPCVSHTFGRREIAALEALGVEVERFTIRPTDPQALSDADDRAEGLRTHALLDGGAASLARATLGACLSRPRKFAEAVQLAARLGLRSERGLLRNLAYLGEACVLLREAEARGVDHVHAHFGTNSAAVAMLTRVLGGPSYSFTAHGPEEFDAPRALSLRDKIARAAFVVGVSQFGRSQLLRHTPEASWPRIHEVRCGLDAAFLTRPRSSVPDVPDLVCVGRLCEQKGQLVLIDALAALRERGIEARVKLVGDGPMRAAITRRVAELGLEGAVTITGWASSEAVLRAIEAARALVLPSFAEGLPVVIMEAMARGRPVVSTFVAGIPELVDAEVGELVPAGSVDALASALARILSTSAHKLTDMGRRGSHRVARRHDASASAEALRALIVRARHAGPRSEDGAAVHGAGRSWAVAAE
jgi:colanic acid/amylovoran biosynthesis glycosyltransferase